MCRRRKFPRTEKGTKPNVIERKQTETTERRHGDRVVTNGRQEQGREETAGKQMSEKRLFEKIKA